MIGDLVSAKGVLMVFKKLGLFTVIALLGMVALQMGQAKASFEIEQIVDDIKIPWAIAFLPNGDLLVTERKGDLLRVTNGKVVAKISGVPDVRAKGQGGLLDVVLHPDFASNQLIYLSYSDASGSGGSNTSIARGRFDGDTLKDVQTIYQATPNTKNGRHFGSRIVFDEDGYLYFSVGDRGDRDTNPQDKNRDGGKVYRLLDDGQVPTDNPFLGKPGLDAMYSLGHRNIQGMAKHPQTGDIWAHEHGPRGGDEVNIVKAGANYGWPILSYGINYNGTSFAKGTEREGFVSPDWYWDPSIAPSGMAFVTSDKYPDWQGHLLVGSLKFGQLVLCELDGNRIVSAEPVLEKIGRVRDVRQGPDGFIYLAIDGKGIQRVVPAK